MTAGSDGVDAQLRAVDAVIDGFLALQNAAAQTLDAAAAAVRAAQSRTAQEHQTRTRDLQRAAATTAQAERALAACKDNCGPLQRAVAAARMEEDRRRRRVDASTKAMTLTADALSKSAGVAATFQNAVQAHARPGESSARRFRAHITEYLG